MSDRQAQGWIPEVQRSRANLLIHGIPEFVGPDQRRELLDRLEQRGRPVTATWDEAQRMLDSESAEGQRLTAQARSYQQTPERPEPMFTTEGTLGAAARGGATALAYSKIPVVGPVALVTDMIIDTVNGVAGTNWNTTRDYLNQVLDDVGVARPESEAEQLVQILTEAGSSARGLSQRAQRALEDLGPFARNVYQRFLQTFASNPRLQVAEEVVGTSAALAAQGGVAAAGGGPVLQALAGTGAGMTAGAATSAIGEVRPRVNDIVSMQTANRPVVEGQQSPYTRSEQSIAQTGQVPQTQGEAFRRRVTETIPSGAGQYQFRRYHENMGLLSEAFDQFDVGLDEFAQMPDFSRPLMDDFVETRGARLRENIEAKDDVIRYRMTVDPDEAVPTPTAVEYLEGQLAEIGRRDTPASQRLGLLVNEWTEAIQGRDLAALEATRKDLFDQLKSADNVDIRTQGTQILSQAYSHVVDDMGEFIRRNGSEEEYQQWRTANDNLASMARDFEDGALTRMLDEWDKVAENMQPEVVTDLLFSRNPSDVSKLYNSLSSEGQATARQALVSRFAAIEGDPSDMSPTVFARNVGRYGRSVGIFFDAEDLEYLQGLKRHFDITQRAEAMARSSSGYSSLPTGALPGSGTIPFMAVQRNPVTGLAASFLSMSGLGRVARIYEQTPHIRRMITELATLEPDGVAARNLSRIIMQAAESVLTQESQEESVRGTSESDARPTLTR